MHNLDLSILTNEQIGLLRETRQVHEINVIRHRLDLLDEVEASLQPADFLTHFRITLIRGHRYNDAKDYDRTLDLLVPFLRRYESYFDHFHPPAINRFAISLLRLIGDTYLRKDDDGSKASLFYLKMLELPELESSGPFPLLVASSRIALGSWLAYELSDDRTHLETVRYGIDLFHIGLGKAFAAQREEFSALDPCYGSVSLPKPHFFREIAREARHISEVLDQVHATLNRDDQLFFE